MLFMLNKTMKQLAAVLIRTSTLRVSPVQLFANKPNVAREARNNILIN